MSFINRTPPEPPRWQFSIDEDERQQLLGALDIAQAALKGIPNVALAISRWPGLAVNKGQDLSYLEQVLASVSPKDLQ
jgi:hypothetical protein